MIIFSSGYLYLSELTFRIKATKIVRVPTLPKNIVKTKTHLLSGVKVGVKLLLKPTVPNAEKHSKAIAKVFSPFSKAETSNIDTPIASNDRTIVAKALRTESSAISLLLTSIQSLPLAILNTFNKAIANELVLIPPPVLPGEAQIHIKNIVNNLVEGKIAP